MIQPKRFSVALCHYKQVPLLDPEITTLREQAALDYSFNSPERWDLPDRIEYMTSVIRGMAPSNIVIAHIDSCLLHCVPDSFDYNYYNEWKNQNKNWIAVDGNNRTITISKFLKGEVPIEHGEYELPDGMIAIDSSNDRYTTFPKAMRQHLKNITVPICEYVRASRSDLSTLFNCVNDGKPLNGQELRNSKLVPFAKEIRDMAEAYGSSFKFIFKDNNRRVIDEQLVNLSVYYTYGAEHGISKTDKDNAYLDNSSVWREFSKASGGKKVIEETLKIVGKYANAGFKTTSALLNFYMVMVQITKENRKVLDKEGLFKWFMETENKRLGGTELIASNSHGIMRNYSGCCDSTTDKYVLARFNVIMKDLQTITDGLVTTLDAERLFSDTQRYQMWVSQGGKCPQTGKIIAQTEINDHTKWAADHIFAYSKGGTTTLDNGQLVCKIWNESKGAKLMSELKAA